MKTLLFILIAVAGFAQTRLEVSPQCGANQIVVVVAFQTTVGVTVPMPICVSLDPASFNLQTQVQANVATGTLFAKAPSAPALPTFVDGEIPAGTIDGTNPAFTLAAAPNPATSLHLYRNGVRLSPGGDFAVSGQAITFMNGAIPGPGDILRADYRK